MDYDQTAKFLRKLDVRALEEELASALDSALDTGLAFDAAIRLVGTGHILAATSAEELSAGEEDAVSDWDCTYPVESAFDGRVVVTCGNPSGLYENWGLAAVALADAWYVYDWGEAKNRGRLWARSSPANDGAFAEAAVNAWVSSYRELLLPPFMNGCWDGDAAIALTAVERLIWSSDTVAWKAFVENLPGNQFDEEIAELDWADYGLETPPDPKSFADMNKFSDYSRPPADTETRAALVLIYLAHRRGCP